jgi:hypothetical protein
MRFLHKKVLLTKENLIKRKWQGSEKCCFCDHKETVQHHSMSFSKNGLAYCSYDFLY